MKRISERRKSRGDEPNPVFVRTLNDLFVSGNEVVGGRFRVGGSQ